jgi:pyruvate dehydrogenase E1 component alpha subunit
MDVVAVYGATRAAVDKARQGDGPSYVVCDTYRFLGHHVGDPLSYRTKEEVLPWKAKDPIPTFAARLVADRLVTKKQVAEWDTAAKRAIADALVFAEASPDPDPTDLTAEVFA